MGFVGARLTMSWYRVRGDWTLESTRLTRLSLEIGIHVWPDMFVIQERSIKQHTQRKTKTLAKPKLYNTTKPQKNISESQKKNISNTDPLQTYESAEKIGHISM